MNLEHVSLASLGYMVHHEASEEALDELMRRCNQPDKVKVLFNYHAKTFAEQPNDDHFYQMLAISSLMLALATSSRMGASK